MNLLGKIFVVLILVSSVLFMAFAMAVYATHRNWREAVKNEQATPDKPLGLEPQLRREQARNKELSDEKEKLGKQINAEKAARDQAVAKLEAERDLAQTELKALQAKLADLENTTRESVAAMKATQANATRDRKEVESQREVLADARKDRDLHFKEVTRLTDRLNQEVNDKDQLKKRTVELAKDLAKADQLLKKFGLDKNKNFADVPPMVDGVVQAVLEGGVVEISLGSDDGLIKGHRLEVYRIGGGQNTYVGRIEVVKTQPDRSVCKVDPKFQNSNVMVGDRVASKIQ